MALQITHPELFGVTETSVTVSFDVEDAGGPVDAEARVLVNGEERAQSGGSAGTRLVRIEGLEPHTTHRVEVQVDGAAPVEPNDWFTGQADTSPGSQAAQVASFATLNDLHFGEPRCGGTLTEDHDYGPEAPEFPAVTENDDDVPYWRYMNEDAIQEINAERVDLTIIKGDIADRGRPEQFEAAAKAFSQLEAPHHAFLGNHDYYGLNDGLEVDGYALLGQPRAPRCVELAGWRLVLLETTVPGYHHGEFGVERRRWLTQQLEESRERRTPTLLFMHHHPVPPERRNQFPNRIGIKPEDSVELFQLLAGFPEVRGVLIGHTHRNRVRHYPSAGPVPFVEVNCTKDYPGGWAHYRLYEDGSFRQEVRRTGSSRALAHSARCRGFFRGMYKPFALGPLEARSFTQL